MVKSPFLLFVLLVILSLSFLKISAQNKGFTGGLFLNANGIHFEGDNEIFWQSYNGNIWGGGGLSGGLFVKRNISQRIDFSLELRFVQKGCVFEFANEYGTRSVETMRLNYFEIPLLIGYSFQIKHKSFIAQTGLAYARQISSDMQINELTSQNEISNINNFKNNDLSWVCGFKFPINEKKKNNLLFGFRTSYSIKSIHEYYNLRNLVYGLQLEYVI